MRIFLAAALLLQIVPTEAVAALARVETGGAAPVRAAAASAGLSGLGVSLSATLSPLGTGDARPVLDKAFDAAASAPVSAAAAPLAPASNAAPAPLAAASAAGPSSGAPKAEVPAPTAPHPSEAKESPLGSTPGGAAPSGPRGPQGPQGPKVNWRAAIPNFITGLNLASGLAAAMLAAQGALLPAAGLIILANIFDGLDGRAARALGVSSPIGAELDSLADVVSFGAAPAVLLYKAALAPLGPLGFAAAAIYAGAGAFRLARFNLGAYAEREGKAPAKKKDAFVGMPIPGGAGVLVAASLVLPHLPAATAGAVGTGVALVAAAAMASTLPYPAFKKGGAKALLAPALVGGGAAAALALLGLPLWIPAAVFGLYLLAGPAGWLYEGGSETFKRELKRKAFHQLTWLYLPGMLLLGLPRAAWAMAAWTAGVGLLEALRLYVPAAKPHFAKLFGGIIREKEANRASGSFFVALGMTVAAALFGSNPAAVFAAVAALALGDAASPLVGLRFGWKPYDVMGTRRSVDGTLAAFAVVTAIGLAFGFSPLVALGAALAFSVVDVIPVKPDDNLWIPVVYSAALFLLSRL